MSTGLVKGLELAPAQFASAAAFFGIGVTAATLSANLVPQLLGFLLGYIFAILPNLVSPNEEMQEKV